MVDEVDPRGPRFGQGVTAVLALGGLAVQEPAVVYLLTVLLVVPVVSRWRVDPYGFAWRHGPRQLLGPPADRESAIPHRFARVIGAAVTTAASLALLTAAATGLTTLVAAGYALVGIVGLLAALGATTGICVGCRMYRQVGRFRNLGLLTSPRR